MRVRRILRHPVGLGEKYGLRAISSPLPCSKSSKGGISDWGTICGALLGPASAYLFWGKKERNHAMVSELYRWYKRRNCPSSWQKPPRA